jgi:hypothetical protein
MSEFRRAYSEAHGYAGLRMVDGSRVPEIAEERAVHTPVLPGSDANGAVPGSMRH